MTASTQFQPFDCFDLTASIASGQATSQEIDLSGAALCGLIMPSAFTGTAITIQMTNASGGTYVPVQSQGAIYSLTVSPSLYVPVENLAIVAGLRWIKLVSNASEAAARSIILAARPV